MRHLLAGVIVAVLCASSIATNAQADPLTITTGEFAFGAEIPGELIYDFRGEGFEFGLRGPFGSHIRLRAPLPAGFELPCVPSCLPGEHLSFSSQTDGTVALGRGPVTIDGTSYSDVQLSGTLSFLSDGVSVPPAAPAGAHQLLRAPFTFDGTFLGHVGGEQVFAHAFRGSGIASTDLISQGGSYVLEGPQTLLYRFTAAPVPDPVPEPATLLLVGTSLALGLGRRRAWRRTSRGPHA